MVPTLKITQGALKNNGFINGYAKDHRRDVQYENCIYLLFCPVNIDRFREFLVSEYERTESIIDEYDYEKGYVVVVYKLNELYVDDFKLIRIGSYSKTSKAFQLLFPKVLKIVRNGLSKDELSLQYRIFCRTTDLIEFWENKLDVSFNSKQEVWEGYSEDLEILNLNKIIENV